MSVPMRRRLLLPLGLVAVAGLLYLAFRPKPLRVDVAQAIRGPLAVTVEAEGETRVRDRYVVAAPVAGRLTRVQLKAGDSVRRDAVVALLAPAPLDARGREQAEARLEAARDTRRMAAAAAEQARAALAQAERTAVRAESLAARNLEPQAAREDAQTLVATRSSELEAADFRAQAAAHDVQVAQAALLAAGNAGDARTALRLHAPVSGVVLRVVEESERVILAGAPILELGDPATLEVVSDLLSTDAIKVHPGDTVLLRDWGGDGPLRARLRRVEPSGFTKVSALGVEEQRVNVIADFIDPPGRLGDRFKVDLAIVIWQGQDVLQVPTSALFRRAGHWQVFVVEKGRARSRAVEVGEQGPLAAQIVRGINPGETVIVHPSDRVDDGVRVTSSGS